MKSRKVFSTAIIIALALDASFASAALAHGDVADGHSEQLLGVDLSFLLIPPEFVLGGVAFFGGSLRCETAQRMSGLLKMWSFGAGSPGCGLV